MSGSMPLSKIVGVFELIKLPMLGPQEIIAKLDTGAYSGALHCSQIRQIASDFGTILEFYPLDQKTPVTTDEFAVRFVKSSNGKREKRYFIETNIVLSGKKYPIVLSLSDRSKMRWQVLIGRKFLKQHGFVVDASKPSRYGKARKS